MQYQLTAIKASFSEKPSNPGTASELDSLGLFSHFCHCYGGNFTFDLAVHACLVLLRDVLERKSQERDACRGVPQFGDFRHLTA